MTTAIKKTLRFKRHRRVRTQINGTADRPRLAGFRSNTHIFAQIIDDGQGATLVSADDRPIKKTSNKELSGKIALAYETGLEIGKKALAKNITQVVFDRGGYLYHGRVKALAEGARAAGLKF